MILTLHSLAMKCSLEREHCSWIWTKTDTPNEAKQLIMYYFIVYCVQLSKIGTTLSNTCVYRDQYTIMLNASTQSKGVGSVYLPITLRYCQ